MDKQLPAIYNDPYISEYFKIIYKEHKEDKINETKELLDYISNMEKKIDYMTSEVLELKNTIEQLQNPTIRETMKSLTEDIKKTVDNGKKQLSDIKSNILFHFLQTFYLYYPLDESSLKFLQSFFLN